MCRVPRYELRSNLRSIVVDLGWRWREGLPYPSSFEHGIASCLFPCTEQLGLNVDEKRTLIYVMCPRIVKQQRLGDSSKRKG